MGKVRDSTTVRRLMPVTAGVLLGVSMAAPAAAAPGGLDTGFGMSGKVITDFGQASVANAVAIQSDKKIVAAGRVGDTSAGDFGLARYKEDGTPDSSFGTSGTVTTPFTDSPDVARAVAIQPDGKIVVGGHAGSEGTGDFALARYNSNGTLDTSFGTAGKVTTDLSGGLGDGIRGMAILPDGKILAVGAAGPADGLARYNQDGSLDASFGVDGKAVVKIGNAAHAFSLAPLGNGQFLTAGMATGTLTRGDFMVARFNADGSLDSGFGAGGVTTTDFGGQNDLGFGLAVQKDHRIVVVGATDSLDGLSLTGGNGSDTCSTMQAMTRCGAMAATTRSRAAPATTS